MAFHEVTYNPTLCHVILPMTEDGLTEQELKLLKDDLGLDVKSEADVEVDISSQYKDLAALKKLSNGVLKLICKLHGQTRE